MQTNYILFVLIILVTPVSIHATNGKMSGAGTEANPYLVQDYADLQAVGSGSGIVYRLVSDISASNSHYTNAQFFPGSFSGTFHGGGHTITDLYIQSSNLGSDSMGLFAVAYVGSLIDSLTLVKAEISGRYYVGAIVGNNRGVISNCHVDSTSKVKGNGNVGGLTGGNSGGIYFSTYYGSVSTGIVSGIGTEFGGLVGSMYSGTIDNCFVKGYVSGTSKDGGLIGHLIDGRIRNCSSKVSVYGDDFFGGFVGLQDGGTIKNCSAAGILFGEQTAGGFVGKLSNGTIQSCYSEVKITLNAYNKAEMGGGFVGDILDGTIEGCMATATVSGQKLLGGFIGHMTKGTITKCSAAGTINGTHDSIGCFVGSIVAGTIERCVSSGTASGRSAIGGFAGVNKGDITMCATSGNGAGKGMGDRFYYTPTDNDVGGFAGINYGNIRKCSAMGNVTMSDTLYSSGANLGGFAGVNNGTVENCFSQGNTLIDTSVNIQDQNGYGLLCGFTGYNSGTIKNSYAAGKVFGFDTSLIYVGFAGLNKGGTISDCYWDKEIAKRDTGVDSTTVPVNLSGKTSAEMKLQSTFVNWDFTTVWSTSGDTRYPSFLAMNHAPEIILTALETDANVIKKVKLTSLVKDPDGDSLCIRILEPAEYGTFFIDSANAQYSPLVNFSGEDSLLLWVSDGVLNNSAWIKVTVGSQVSLKNSRTVNIMSNMLSIVQTSENLLDIDFTTPAGGHTQLEIYSLTGQRILTADQGIISAGTHHTSLLTAGMKSGIYSVVLRIDRNVATKARMVKYR